MCVMALLTLICSQLKDFFNQFFNFIYLEAQYNIIYNIICHIAI